MNPLWRLTALLLICLVALTACAVTPTLNARQQAVAAASTDRVELAAGRYQLLMFYSPL